MANEIDISKLTAELKELKGIKTPKAMLAGALVIQRYSMQNAPVETGFLRNSHISRETDDGAEMVVQAEYAGYVEFGTSKMNAQPYVRPAIDENSTSIVSAVADEILKEIMEGK